MATLTDLLTQKMPPHSAEAERAVLGAAIAGGAAEAARVAGWCADADFYLEKHRQIMVALRGLVGAQTPVDLVNLRDALRSADALEEIGGPAYLAQLVEEADLPMSVEAHCGLIRREAARRALIRACMEAIGQSYDQEDVAAVAQALASASTAALAQADGGGDGTAAVEGPARAYSIAEVIEETLREMESEEPPPFITTPIPKLNRYLLGGFLPGDLVYFGGRPGSGKTAMDLAWVIHAARTHQARSLVISAEMMRMALGRRWLAQQAHVAASKLRQRDLDADEWQRLLAAQPRLASLPVSVSDDTFSLRQIAALVRAGRKEAPPLRYLVIDYLQLLQGPKAARNDGRRLEIEAISAGLKRLAKRHGLVVLCLSSLSRAKTERGTIRRPTMADLRESGSLEHDADWVLFLWQPDETKSDRQLIVAKGRDGETGDVDLTYQGEYLTFWERSEREEEHNEGQGER